MLISRIRNVETPSNPVNLPFRMEHITIEQIGEETWRVEGLVCSQGNEVYRSKTCCSVSMHQTQQVKEKTTIR